MQLAELRTIGAELPRSRRRMTPSPWVSSSSRFSHWRFADQDRGPCREGL